jgi:hypothetical protein
MNHIESIQLDIGHSNFYYHAKNIQIHSLSKGLHRNIFGNYLSTLKFKKYINFIF